eukprot:1400338-Amphidinium_carterae.2
MPPQYENPLHLVDRRQRGRGKNPVAYAVANTISSHWNTQENPKAEEKPHPTFKKRLSYLPLQCGFLRGCAITADC